MPELSCGTTFLSRELTPKPKAKKERVGTVEKVRLKGLPAIAAKLVFCADGKKIAVVYDVRGFRAAMKAEIRSVDMN
jgi:hypothetical protein